MAVARRVAGAFNLVNIVAVPLLFVGGIWLSRLLSAPRFGVALVAITLLMTLPLAMVLISRPKFGVALLFVLSMVIIEIKRFSWQTEVGLVIEFLEGMLAIGLLTSMIARRDLHRLGSPLTLPVLIYVLYQVLQALHPNLPSVFNILYALRDPINFAVPFFAAVYLIRDKTQLRFFLGMWMLLAVAIALYGLKQNFLGLSNWEAAWLSISRTHIIYDKVRIFSMLGSADALGMHMAVSIVLALGLAFSTRSRLVRYGCIATVPLFVVVDLYTLTRGAYSAVLVGVLVLAVITRSRLLLVGLLLAAVLAVGWYQVNQGSMLANRVMTMFSPEEDESFAVRQSYIDEYLPVIAENPFGFGPATSGRQGWVLLEWAGVDPSLVESLAGVPADNYYFRIALENGWVGLLLFMVLLAVVISHGLRVFYSAKDPLVRWTAASLVAAYVAMAVASVSNNYFSHVQLKLFFWFSIGVLANLPKIEQAAGESDQVKESAPRLLPRMGGW